MSLIVPSFCYSVAPNQVGGVPEVPKWFEGAFGCLLDHMSITHPCSLLQKKKSFPKFSHPSYETLSSEEEPRGSANEYGWVGACSI